MDNIIIKQGKENSHISFIPDEKGVLGHIARLLVSENLINLEEQLRFLSVLKEGK